MVIRRKYASNAKCVVSVDIQKIVPCNFYVNITSLFCLRLVVIVAIFVRHLEHRNVVKRQIYGTSLWRQFLTWEDRLIDAVRLCEIEIFVCETLSSNRTIFSKSVVPHLMMTMRKSLDPMPSFSTRFSPIFRALGFSLPWCCVAVQDIPENKFHTCANFYCKAPTSFFSCYPFPESRR